MRSPFNKARSAECLHSPPVRWGLLDFMLALTSFSSSSSSFVSSCDLNREPVRPVFRAGPQPRSCVFSVLRRTSAASLWGQCSAPDLSRDPVCSVFRAGPQPRSCEASVPRRTSTAKICQKECQKICQKICQKECQKICQKICQKECQKICQKECQKICQKECQKICQKICRKECQKICRKECQKICLERMSKDMSERMSKDMSERMSKDMSEITQRKVFAHGRCSVEDMGRTIWKCRWSRRWCEDIVLCGTDACRVQNWFEDRRGQREDRSDSLSISAFAWHAPHCLQCARLVDLRRAGGLEDDDWWLAMYVMLTRARKLENLILLGFTEQVEELLRRGPPSYLRVQTDKLEAKAAATLERLQNWPVYDSLQTSWHLTLHLDSSACRRSDRVYTFFVAAGPEAGPGRGPWGRDGAGLGPWPRPGRAAGHGAGTEPG